MLEIQDIAKLHGVWSTYYPSALKGDRDIHTPWKTPKIKL